jgi:hypothetical protein
VNRAELQQLAADRILDAQALLAAGRWSGAYYLTGYAVECGLKSCVLAYVERTGVIFEDRKFLEGCWTHELERLVNTADLQRKLGPAKAANPALARSWDIAIGWKETSRYQQKTQPEAEELYEAVTNDPNGVLRWIQICW